MRSILLILVCVVGCSKKPAEKSNDKPAASGSFLTLGAYCDGVCGKLCGTCGGQQCAEPCKTRCLFNRSPETLLDGKDPKTALAKTQQSLDECTAAITTESCPKFMAGEVPPVCFTIQH